MFLCSSLWSITSSFLLDHFHQHTTILWHESSYKQAIKHMSSLIFTFFYYLSILLSPITANFLCCPPRLFLLFHSLFIAQLCFSFQCYCTTQTACQGYVAKSNSCHTWFITNTNHETLDGSPNFWGYFYSINAGKRAS